MESFDSRWDREERMHRTRATYHRLIGIGGVSFVVGCFAGAWWGMLFGVVCTCGIAAKREAV